MKRVKPSRLTKIGLVGAFSVLLLFLCRTSADPLYVSLSAAQYMTYVQAQGSPAETYPSVSRTTTSPSPIDDEIDQPITDMWPGMVSTNYAIASAGMFAVSDRTGWGFANAEAVSQVWFTPLTDQTGTIGIQIAAWGRYPANTFTAGEIDLLDVTGGSEVWSYSWNYGGSADLPDDDDVPWDVDSNNTSANFSLAADFLASHQYRLVMIAASNAGDDSESVQISLTGLQAVPEPPTILVIALSGIALASWRRRPAFKSSL